MRPIYLVTNINIAHNQSNNDTDIIHLPLIKTVFLAPTQQDWQKALHINTVFNPQHSLKDIILILSSKTAIQALINLCIPLQDQKAFVVGASTQKIFNEYGGIVVAKPDQAYGEQLTKTIQAHITKDTQTLYVRAKKTFSNPAKELQKMGYLSGDIIVYETLENNIKSHADYMPPPPYSHIIFTAPSYYHAFYHQFGWHHTWQAIVIGQSTFNALHKDIQRHAHIAPQQSLQACITLAKNLLQ